MYFTSRKSCLILMVYSSLLILLAVKMNLFTNDEFAGYKALNWSPYPIFWIFIFFLYDFTWGSFLKAWSHLFSNGVVVSQVNGSLPTKEQIEKIFKKFNSFRVSALVVAVILTSVIMFFDMKDILTVYNGKHIKKILKYKTVITDVDLDKPIEKKVKAGHVIVAKKEIFLKIDGKIIKLDKDWTVPWLVSTETATPKKCFIFLCLAYLQQGLVILLGFASLFNILLHQYFFVSFERLTKKIATGFKIKFDYKSKIYEFGLERWNYSLNNLYWILSGVIVIPFLSQANNSSEELGQLLIRYVVPIIFIVPMVVTILIRQCRLPDVWDAVRQESQENVDLFHKQLLWPLDKNWASKLGIVIAFYMMSLLIGSSVYKLIF